MSIFHYFKLSTLIHISFYIHFVRVFLCSLMISYDKTICISVTSMIKIPLIQLNYFLFLSNCKTTKNVTKSKMNVISCTQKKS